MMRDREASVELRLLLAGPRELELHPNPDLAREIEHEWARLRKAEKAATIARKRAALAALEVRWRDEEDATVARRRVVQRESESESPLLTPHNMAHTRLPSLCARTRSPRARGEALLRAAARARDGYSQWFSGPSPDTTRPISISTGQALLCMRPRRDVCCGQNPFSFLLETSSSVTTQQQQKKYDALQRARPLAHGGSDSQS